MASKQFPDVSCNYGAPMGRPTSPLGEKVRVFRVRLDSGGYDDGGAYWGIGGDLYCAQCDEGGQQFVRSHSRLSAIVEFQIEASQLKCPPRAEVKLLRELEAKGVLGASGIILRQRLDELRF